MIKLYTYQELLIPGNRKQVHPLLFDLHYYENAHQSVHNHYQLVDQLELADAFIFPINYYTIPQKGYLSQFNELYELAKAQNKKLLVYTGGDYGTTFNDEAIITWRNAGFKSANNSQTMVVPAFMNDPLERNDLTLNIHDYKDQPQISFTGFANSSILESLRVSLSTIKGNFKRLLNKDKSDAQSIYNAAGKRYSYLKQLELDSVIQTDFIYRDKYRAGAVNELQREQTTTEFFQNLNNSPYTFCLRGAGNFSVRFYEALALGKIPVLVDTDVQLPLEKVIDWDLHICRVQVDQDISKALLEFHQAHHSDSFIDLQKSNRLLYENYLVRHAYFCHLHDPLKTLLS